MLFQFYTNLTFEDNEDDVHIYSFVKGMNIKLSPKSIGRILSISYHGLSINDINMDDAEVLSSIFLSGQGLPMTNNKLKSIPRLIVGPKGYTLHFFRVLMITKQIRAIWY